MRLTPSTRPHIIDESASFATLELSLHVPLPHDHRSEALQSVYTDILFAGCGPYDRAAFLDALGNIGALISIRAYADTVIVRLRARTEVLKKALDLLSLMMEKPHFSAKELQRIKKRLVEEIKLEKENAKARAYQNLIDALVAPTDPRYEHDLDKVRGAVSGLTVSDVRRLHTLVRSASIHYACGGPSAACREIDRTLDRLNFRLDASGGRAEPLRVRTSTGRSIVLVDIPHKSNIEFEMGAGISMLRTDPDFAPLQFGMSVLGLRGGFAGRLMSIVREKEGLTYGIYGQVEGIRTDEEGFWRISTFFAPKDAAQGISSTLREIARIRTEGITEDELMRFKQILATRFALIEDSLIKRVSERLMIESIGLTPAAYEAYKEEIATMTCDRVNAALRWFIDPERMVISGAGPIKAVARELKAFSIPRRG